MSLQFIFGNSGAGKSYTLFRSVIEDSIRHPEQSYLVIVPEQFTMQTQKELVRLHPDGGILNIDILSFQRLGSTGYSRRPEPRWERCWRKPERTWCFGSSPRRKRGS